MGKSARTPGAASLNADTIASRQMGASLRNGPRNHSDIGIKDIRPASKSCPERGPHFQWFDVDVFTKLRTMGDFGPGLMDAACSIVARLNAAACRHRLKIAIEGIQGIHRRPDFTRETMFAANDFLPWQIIPPQGPCLEP